MSCSVSMRFSSNDIAGAPQGLLRGGLYDGSIVELSDVNSRELIRISANGEEEIYYQTELLERGKIVYLCDN